MQCIKLSKKKCSKSGGITWWFLWLVGSTFPPIYETWTFDLGRDGGFLAGRTDQGFLNGYGKFPDFYRGAVKIGYLLIIQG